MWNSEVLSSALTGENILDFVDKYDIKFGGIVLNNETDLKKIKLKPHTGYVVNMSPTAPGTHWTAFYCKTPQEPILYFDSFGCPAPPLIEKTLNYEYLYNQYAIQSLTSKACGIYCCLFLAYMADTNGEGYDQFMQLWTPYGRKNEQILKKLILQLV